MLESETGGGNGDGARTISTHSAALVRYSASTGKELSAYRRRTGLVVFFVLAKLYSARGLMVTLVTLFFFGPIRFDRLGWCFLLSGKVNLAAVRVLNRDLFVVHGKKRKFYFCGALVAITPRNWARFRRNLPWVAMADSCGNKFAPICHIWQHIAPCIRIATARRAK